MKDNYYRILGLDNFASAEEIRTMYLRLAKQYHPDKNPDKPAYEETFKRISNAYQVLSDPQKKARYDHLVALSQRHITYRKPVYAARKRYYTSETREYTRSAWMYGRIFIGFFILAVIGIPMIMFYYTSIRAYEHGLREYDNGHTLEALNQFNEAIMLFGGKSTAAAIKGAEICIYDLQIYPQGLYFADRGLHYAEAQEDFATLYYLKSVAYEGEKKYQEALDALYKADSLHYPQDSIQLKSGMLLAFGLSRYHDALQNFNYLISEDIYPDKAWFGMGWSWQHMGLNSKAVSAYEKVIALKPDHALAYYYRGLNKMILTDSAAGCSDLQQAAQWGYAKADEEFQKYCQAQ